MKRGIDDYEIDGNAEKMAKLQNAEAEFEEELDEGTLSKLPKDEYILVLGYLSPEDKKNLKLASKGCERRVMALDPTMRRWTIRINNNTNNLLPDDDFEYNLTLYSDLTKAKAKHLKDGNIDDIEISLSWADQSRNPMIGACIADNIINHWKNNIVQITSELSGYELFFADPTLQLPRLKSLVLIRYFDNEHKANVKSIFSTFIENNAKSLEFLEMRGIDLEIKKKISLKKLTVARVTEPSTFESVLNSTKHSLECLELTDMILEAFDCPQLNLKELVCDDIPHSVLHTVTASCQQTLKTLTIKNFDSDEELDVPPLKLTKLAACSQSIENVTSLIKTCYPTLETLEFEDLKDFEMDDNLDIPNLQKLKQFEAVEVPAEFVKTIIESSTNTLTSLKLKMIKEPQNAINKICEPNLMKLKKLQLNLVSPWCLSIISSASHSLEDIEICDISRIPEFYEVFRSIKLDERKLEHMRKLKLVNIPLILAWTLMRISKVTLKDLVLYGIKDGFSFFLNLKLSLEKFFCDEIDERLMNRILRASSETLQEITLKNIMSCEETLGYDFILPELKRFNAERIKFDVVKSVLKTLQSPLEMLSITGGDMDKVSFNSELLTFLLKFGANNPNCFMRISLL